MARIPNMSKLLANKSPIYLKVFKYVKNHFSGLKLEGENKYLDQIYLMLKCPYNVQNI